MPKWYVGKQCAYCSLMGVTSTPDHVLARKFFSLRRRGNLPQVPACGICNNDKSKLENYVGSVLIAGAEADGESDRIDLFARRMNKNQKLKRHLFTAFTRISDPDTGAPTATLPVDHLRVSALFVLITRGLYAFHFGAPLAAGDLCDGIFISPAGAAWFDERIFRGGGGTLVERELGGRAFLYDYVTFSHLPGFSAWRMSLYGVRLFGDSTQPDVICRQFFAYTLPIGITPEFCNALEKLGLFGSQKAAGAPLSS